MLRWTVRLLLFYHHGSRHESPLCELREPSLTSLCRERVGETPRCCCPPPFAASTPPPPPLMPPLRGPPAAGSRAGRCKERSCPRLHWALMAWIEGPLPLPPPPAAGAGMFRFRFIRGRCCTFGAPPRPGSRNGIRPRLRWCCCIAAPSMPRPPAANVAVVANATVADSGPPATPTWAPPGCS